MNATAAFRETWRQLRRSPGRAWLASLGMAVSVAAMVLLANLVGSAFLALTSGLRQMGANTVVIQPEMQRLGRLNLGRPLSMADVEALRRYGHATLDIVAPVVAVQGMVSACGSRRITRVTGAVPEHAVLESWSVARGRFIRQGDLDEHAHVAVVGATLADSLKCAGQVNAVIRVSNQPYTVVGVLASRGQRFGADLDDTILIPLSTAESKYRQVVQNALGIVVRVRRDSDVRGAVDQVKALLRTRHFLRSGEPDDFIVQTQSELVAGAEFAATTVSWISLVLVSVSLAVAAIGVLNSLFTAVLERTAEIGLRRSVGATRRGIRLQFIGESATIAVAGAAAGAFGGIASSSVVARVLGLPPFVNASVIAIAVLAAIVFGLLAGVLPAIRAASLDPVEALRHE